MEKPSFKLVGAPCGQHGQYTFYKALRVTGATDKIIAIGDFFFVRIWQDSELVSIGELQLLWTDRVSDQTLVSLRLYFLPENTPEGRNLHGEDEVLAINDKVVLRAEDLLSWICDGSEWRWGLRAVWRGACAPPADPRHTTPLHHTKLDFSDVDTEKSSIVIDADAPGVVVFSYPRYCRYRALLSRLEGIQADWLRDSLVAALGGYAAPTNNTRILYCKDTFEYPELEGHEFVCNHLAPRLKGRPRGRRRRPHSPSPGSDRSATESPPLSPPTPRRLSLRNGGDKQSEDEEDDCKRLEQTPEDRAFMHQLKQFYKERNEAVNIVQSLKHMSLRTLYMGVLSRGGYEAVCRHKLWRTLAVDQPARTRRHYERYLLPFENYERRNGASMFKLNGKLDIEPHTIATIDVTDSPLRDDDREKILRTPENYSESREIYPEKRENYPENRENFPENREIKNAAELNQEFLDSLPKEEKLVKISVKPVEKLVEPHVVKLFEENSLDKRDDEVKDMTQSNLFDASKLSIVDPARAAPAPVNGHALPAADIKARPAGRSSLRAVRVKPGRPLHTHTSSTTPPNPLRPDSASSSPPASVSAAAASVTSAPVTNFGIHHPPPPHTHSDDDIVEVPYKPKTPEIIDLDEYPESPQAVKKKKLDILKERGLEVTALPPWNPMPPIISTPMILNPAMQHQIMTQAQLFQMYNIIPPNYSNGMQPPKVIQASSAFGTAGPEKTVYGNPKDPFMPPPHILQGTPIKPLRNIPPTPTPQDILDLTCKSMSPQKPTVEILRVSCQSPSAAQNLSKNYPIMENKAATNQLEITLVNKAHSPSKSTPRLPQKRSSNGKFMSTKTPPPKEFTKPVPSHSPKKPAITIPSYQITDNSPTSSKVHYKGQNLPLMDLQKGQQVPSYLDPYTVALYSSLAGQMDQRQLAMYRDVMTNQFRAYPGLLNLGVSNTPTTKN